MYNVYAYSYIKMGCFIKGSQLFKRQVLKVPIILLWSKTLCYKLFHATEKHENIGTLQFFPLADGHIFSKIKHLKLMDKK